MLEIIKYPNQSEQQALLERPQQEKQNVDAAVKSIIEQVREQGDEALYAFAKAYDQAQLSSLKVSREELADAENLVSDELKTAINTAYDNIYKFHDACFTREYPVIETMPGITCWRKSLPIQKVGLYIPGGSAPLFSTVLMLAIPAQIANTEHVVLCSPTDSSGAINPVVLYTANLCGVTEIYKAGGAGAVAAMTYGTDSIPAVDKIFGPGNAFVTRAKELAQQAGVAIDMPAGPSEVLVIADENANPEFVAADLLAQAEHGPDSQVILLSESLMLAEKVNEEVISQLSTLSRKRTAEQALENSKAIILNDLEECIRWSDAYAPEHLIINTDNADDLANKIKIAGSVFIGPHTCESLGDYASGTNHTLPTYGYARNYSGVSVDSFVNKVTYQKVSSKGMANLGPVVELMAAAEGLDAHKNAVSVRLKNIEANPQPLPAEGESKQPEQNSPLGEMSAAGGQRGQAQGRKKYTYETAKKEIYHALRQRAYHNRMNPTPAEDLLWKHLRNKGIGYKFRRQHVIDQYIVDFVNLDHKLIVEVDGGYHLNQKVEDQEREENLIQLGFKIVRFSNGDVLQKTNTVKAKILDLL